jgi:hypothetical protein
VTFKKLRGSRSRENNDNGYRFRQALAERLESRMLLSADVLTYHNDNARTGQDLSETVLTPANVNATDFGQLFSYPVDGYVFAQPLYVSNLTIPGKGTHNVVFVATEHDSVYAFDADSNSDADAQPLWHDSFIDPSAGITPVPAIDTKTGDITPEVGITGTPVIDPATQTLYVVSNTKKTNATTGAVSYGQQLHALDITTGAEKFGGPADISFSTRGTGIGSAGGKIAFNALTQSQRPGLALNNGTVYIAWASHGDNPPYHGLVAAYNAANLQLESVLNLTPDGVNGGIWMSGDAPAIDSQGNIFVSTGNGTFDNGNGDFGDSLLKITNSNGQLAVADSFTPFNQADLDSFDIDFGSGGLMLLPTQSGATSDEIIAGGKDGNLYLANSDKLGGYLASANSNLQTVILGDANSGIYDTTAYFNGSIYVNGRNAPLQSIPIINGMLSSTVTSSPDILGFPGATPSISANGSLDGIAWEIEYGTTAVLHAFDANNVADELYNSNQSGARDQLGQGAKFAVPTVANGHVYVGTATSLVVFGLLSTSATVVPPAPTNLTATTLTPTDIHLTWQQNSTNATTFQIERSTDGVNFAAIGSAARTSNSYDDITVDVGKTYTYRVEAINGAGSSVPSNVASASTPAVAGLVAYWQFNEGDGITTADASGNDDTGTLNGEVSWIPGRVGPAALNFHGAGVQDAHVAFPNEPQIQFTAADSFTVGVWVQPNALDSKWAGIVTKSTDMPMGYGLYLDPSNHWAFATSSGTNVIEGPLADTNWHYLTLVQDGQAGTRQLYVDGVLSGSGPAEDGSGAGDLWVGGSKSTIQEYFNGAVDDLSIYNTALGVQQIQDLSKVPATLAPGNGSISGTVFEDDQGTGVQENGEPGTSGVTVFLDETGLGIPEPNEPTTVTDSLGNYRFSGLADGTYHVVAVPANEEHLTTPPAGFATVTLSGSPAITGVNFGEVDNDEAPVPAQFKLAITTKLAKTAVGGVKAATALRVTNTAGSVFNNPLQLLLFMSTSPVLDSTAYSVAAPAFRKIVLRPGQSRVFPLQFTFPSTAPGGSYYLIGSVTAEKSDGEDQFVVASTTQVTLIFPTVDLKAAIVNRGAIAVTAAQSGVADVRITNVGTVLARGAVTLSLYTSADDVLDSDDTLLHTLTRRMQLRPGQSITVAVPFKAAAGLQPGGYFVIAGISSRTAPPDFNSDNNTAAAMTRLI